LAWACSNACDGADARAWRLRLSDDGRTTLKRIEQPFKRINQTIESVLDKEEIVHFADYLGASPPRLMTDSWRS